MLTSTWTKARRSNPSGNCVECKFVGPERSNGNGGNNCVEVALNTVHDGAVLIRDSKDPDGLMLTFTPEEWTGYINMLKLGFGAIPNPNQSSSSTWLIARKGGVLTFTTAEWVAFMDGVHKGEFDTVAVPA